MKRLVLLLTLVSACAPTFEDLAAQCHQDGGSVKASCQNMPDVRYVQKGDQHVMFERDKRSCSYKCVVPAEKP